MQAAEVMIWDDKQPRCIAELSFRSQVNAQLGTCLQRRKHFCDRKLPVWQGWSSLSFLNGPNRPDRLAFPRSCYAFGDNLRESNLFCFCVQFDSLNQSRCIAEMSCRSKLRAHVENREQRNEITAIAMVVAKDL